MRGRWVWDRRKMKMVPADEYYARKWADVTISHLAAPMVVGDIEPYRSVVDGSVIGGRRQHREHLKANGCVEVGNDFRRPTRAELPPVGEDIKRAMEDESLRAEALAAERRAADAVR